MFSATYQINLEYDPKPVPTKAFDWMVSVDGMEEMTTFTGQSPGDVLHQLAEWFDAEEEAEKNGEQEE